MRQNTAPRRARTVYSTLASSRVTRLHDRCSSAAETRERRHARSTRIIDFNSNCFFCLLLRLLHLHLLWQPRLHQQPLHHRRHAFFGSSRATCLMVLVGVVDFYPYRSTSCRSHCPPIPHTQTPASHSHTPTPT